MYKTKLTAAIAVMSLLLLAACSQFDDLEGLGGDGFERDFALPLVNTSFSINDILEKFEDNASLTVDPDGLLRFRYSGDVITKSSEEVFAAINATLAQFPLIPLSTGRQALPFGSPDGLQMDRLDLKAGDFAYGFQHTHPKALTVTLTLPTVTKNGIPLSYVVNMPAYSGSGDAVLATNFFFPTSIAGYTIQAEANDSIYVEHQASDVDGAPVSLTFAAVRIQNLSFYYAEGYLGNQLYEGGRDTIYIDFFENWVRGDVYFEDPVITFNFENSFGLPTRSIINVFNVFTVRGEVLPLQSDFITNGVDFPYPELNEVGQVKTKAFTFNKNNSNIDVVLGAGPVAIDYDVNAFTNPDMITSIRGFITDSSYYKVRVDVDLPLYGRASDFVAREQFPVNLAEYEAVEEAEFKLVADNSLPLGIGVQAYFLDEAGAYLDSLFVQEEALVAGAPVDAAGNVTQALTKTSFVTVSGTRFDNLRQAKTILLTAAFSTTGNGTQSVKIRANQKIDLRMGVKVKVKG